MASHYVDVKISSLFLKLEKKKKKKKKMKRLKILQAVLEFTKKLQIQGLKFFTKVLHGFLIIKLSAIKNQKYKMNNVLVDKSLSE